MGGPKGANMKASGRFKYLLGGYFVLILDKVKLSVRRGQKAAGLLKEMAGLPKDEPTVS